MKNLDYLNQIKLLKKVKWKLIKRLITFKDSFTLNQYLFEVIDSSIYNINSQFQFGYDSEDTDWLTNFNRIKYVNWLINMINLKNDFNKQLYILNLSKQMIHTQRYGGLCGALKSSCNLFIEEDIYNRYIEYIFPKYNYMNARRLFNASSETSLGFWWPINNISIRIKFLNYLISDVYNKLIFKS